MILANDLFQILADSLRYPQIKDAIDNLEPWERKNLVCQLEELMFPEFEKEYQRGVEDGVSEGRKKVINKVVNSINSISYLPESDEFIVND